MYRNEESERENKTFVLPLHKIHVSKCRFIGKFNIKFIVN
jgi:hypothetical protein